LQLQVCNGKTASESVGMVSGSQPLLAQGRSFQKKIPVDHFVLHNLLYSKDYNFQELFIKDLWNSQLLYTVPFTL